MRKIALASLILAAALGVTYGAAHALGLRETVGLLSGSMPSGQASPPWIPALAYVALHFAFVLIAPILALAAAILTTARSLSRERP
jgi:hypothetical protein